MNIHSQQYYLNQSKYAYYYEVKENVKFKDIYDFIMRMKMVCGTWSNNCRHFVGDIIKTFKK